MNLLLVERSALYQVKEEVRDNKLRTLHVPTRGMRRCHERILTLLKRIGLPDFIRSPRKKSSAWDNAAEHMESASITSFDVKGFYPSTTEEHVFRFFCHRLEMSPDCARVLAQLCTVDGILPQGSPASPHLASLTHLDLFEEAHAKTIGTSNRLTVWVDDVTISGPAVRRDILASVKDRIRSKGLFIHKERRGGGGRGIELTGAYIRKKALAVANSSHLRIRDLTNELNSITDPGLRYSAFNRLASMTRYQRTVLSAAGQDTQRLDARLIYYKREMKKLSTVLSESLPTITAIAAGLKEDGEAF